MSGFVASFTAVADDVSAISTLAFGALGGVVLGDFAFAGFEVPATIAFGGAQQMDVKRLIGGERVVDLLGPDDRNIDWSGTFIDNDPPSRAQTLDQMRADGNALSLTWGTFFYTVMIARFDADARYGRVDYRISCLVLRNEASVPIPAQPGLLSALTNDLNAALPVAGTATAALTTVQSDLSAVTSLLPGSSAFTGLARDIGAAQGVLGGIQAGAETALNGVAAAGAAIGQPVASAAGISSAVTQTGLLAQAMQAVGFVNRMAVNVGIGPPGT